MRLYTLPLKLQEVLVSLEQNKVSAGELLCTHLCLMGKQVQQIYIKRVLSSAFTAHTEAAHDQL